MSTSYKKHQFQYRNRKRCGCFILTYNIWDIMNWMTEVKTKAFEAAYQRLNPEQKAAVDAVEGPVMVIAGPGTGKTEILTLRIANIMLKTGTPPEGILALTFTESAARGITERLVQLIGPEGYRVTVTTFHGFANSIIQNYPDEFPEILGRTNATEAEQVKVMKEILEGTPLEALKTKNNHFYYLGKILGAIDELKRENVTPEEFRTLIDAEEKSKELALVYRKYEEELARENLYDYNDMIMKVANTLGKNKNLLSTLREQYLYILVDEHQDTNKSQNKILELLAGFYENPNLFVVGDVKQAIFRFQGASLENFLYFKSLYKDVKLITLKENYRSTQTILDAAYNLAKRDEKLTAKTNHAESPVKICGFTERSAENYFIAQKISELLKAGEKAENIAIIFRENKDGDPVADMLGKIGIPFVVESDDNALNDPDIKKLRDIIFAVENYGDEEAFYRALQTNLFRIPPLDLYRLSVSRRTANLYDVAKSKHVMAEAGIENREAVFRAYDLLSLWKKECREKNALELLSDIARDSGLIEKILKDEEGALKLQKLHALFNHVRSLTEAHKDFNLPDFAEYLRILEEHGLKVRNTSRTVIPGRVRLMTAHKSKGLEFNVVFIVNAVEGRWGGKKRRDYLKLPGKVFSAQEEDDGEAAEELNVFYVALTRAKREVFITYSMTKDSGERALPTRFINELKPELTETINAKKYENEFNANLAIEFAETKKQAPLLEEKEYLNRLFKEQGLSVTALNNYLKCPWRYFYRNLIRIPEAPEASLMYGSAVHAALKSYFEDLKKGEEKGEKYFIDTFKATLSREPLKRADYEHLAKRGEKALSGYFETYAGSWNTNVILEKSIRDVEIDGIKLVGKLDKIEILNNAGRVNVVDYKTGTVKSENEIKGLTKSSDGDNLRQLIFYKILLDKSEKNKFTMISGTIDFVEPNPSGNYKKYTFDISQDDAAKLSEIIKEKAGEIMDLSFWNTYCDDKDCEYCKLRKMSLSGKSL